MEIVLHSCDKKDLEVILLKQCIIKFYHSIPQKYDFLQAKITIKIQFSSSKTYPLKFHGKKEIKISYRDAYAILTSLGDRLSK